MNTAKKISLEKMRNYSIEIHEPFAEFLMADPEEYRFAVSLLDVVRFAGHACPSMIGAFLISQRVVKELFPQTNICLRGHVSIEIPSSVTRGATGPISNVFSMIFGAWEKSGFGGLQGQFIRRDLIKYEVPDIPAGSYRFTNLMTNKRIDISYHPSRASMPTEGEQLPFQKIWHHKINEILETPEAFIDCAPISPLTPKD